MRITGNKVEFFTESGKESSSVTKLTEQEIVRLIFENNYTKEIIVEELSGLAVNEIIYKLEVKQPLLNEQDQQTIGDIDAIIIPKKNPEKAIIVEFKRIKVNTLKDKSVISNKISKARNKGFSQIKKLRRFNYFKTYLGVIIEDDARNVESANTIIRRSQDDSVETIYEINDDDKLEKNAGLFFITMTQPTGENINLRFNFGLNIEKNAVGMEQDNTITERVYKLTKE